MTRLDAMLAAYRALGCAAEQTVPGASEYDDLVDELTAVMDARSERVASKVVQWWDCWDGRRGEPHSSATAWCREFRRLVSAMETEPTLPAQGAGVGEE